MYVTKVGSVVVVRQRSILQFVVGPFYNESKESYRKSDNARRTFNRGCRDQRGICGLHEWYATIVKSCRESS